MRLTSTVMMVCKLAVTAEFSMAAPMPIVSLASSDFRFVRSSWLGSQCQSGDAMCFCVENALRNIT